MMHQVFDSLTTNRASGSVVLQGDQFVYLIATGTFELASLNFQIRPNGAIWQARGAILFEPGVIAVEIPHLSSVRVQLFGGTGGQNVSAWTSVPIPGS